MSKINIDELCEPIEVTVGGKTYTVDDISQETAGKMSKMGGDEANEDPKLVSEILIEILHANKADINKLGLRKRTMLILRLMEIINEELEGKNVPKAVLKKLQS